MRLIPGSSASLNRRFVLLAPHRSQSNIFSKATVDASLHRRLLMDAQKLRARIYLEDGAIEESQLMPDGRHVQQCDDESWHLLTLDDRGRVAACTRYLPHSNEVSFSDLTVSRSSLALSDIWGRKFRSAIEAELNLARSRRCSYVEMGGWAISEKLRCTTEAVRMVLASYALAQLMGGALGISTVTTRHHSSSILRRIGGASLLSRGSELPPYYDPQYKCEMEILRFDSSRPSPRYRTWVDDCRTYLQTAPVLCGRPDSTLEQIQIAIAERFQHTDRTSSITDVSDEPLWERSTGVA